MAELPKGRSARLEKLSPRQPILDPYEFTCPLSTATGEIVRAEPREPHEMNEFHPVWDALIPLTIDRERSTTSRE